MLFILLDNNGIVELLQNYSVTDIILVLILFIIGTVGVWKAIDFIIDKIKNKDKNQQSTDKKIEDLNTRIDRLENHLDKLNIDNMSLKEDVQVVYQNINRLLESDKDDIKSWITEKYHLYISQGWIDDYSLDCLEKRYMHYKDEGGNSFIEQMMLELRKLPHNKQ